MLQLGFPGGSERKEFAGNAGDLGSIPMLRRSPGERKGYSLHGEFHGNLPMVENH